MLSSLDLMSALKSLYHGCAQGTDLKKAAFSYLSPSGRCETCKGTGREEVALDVLADLALPCPVCGGARYRPSVLELQWQGRNVTEFLDEPIAVLRDELSTGKLQAAVLHQLAARGHLIVAAEHRTSLIAAADVVIELGPGSGAAGGRLA